MKNLILLTAILSSVISGTSYAHMTEYADGAETVQCPDPSSLVCGQMASKYYCHMDVSGLAWSCASPFSSDITSDSIIFNRLTGHYQGTDFIVKGCNYHIKTPTGRTNATFDIPRHQECKTRYPDGNTMQCTSTSLSDPY